MAPPILNISIRGPEDSLTLGDGDVVSLTGDVVHPTVGIGRGVGRRGCGSETDFEGVRRVLNAAVAGLLSDTDGVVLVGQVDSPSEVVALQSPSRSCEPLGTAGPWSPLCSALYLTAIRMSSILNSKCICLS